MSWPWTFAGIGLFGAALMLVLIRRDRKRMAEADAVAREAERQAARLRADPTERIRMVDGDPCRPRPSARRVSPQHPASRATRDGYDPLSPLSPMYPMHHSYYALEPHRHVDSAPHHTHHSTDSAPSHDHGSSGSSSHSGHDFGSSGGCESGSSGSGD